MVEETIAVRDLIDFKEFQQLMDEFYLLTGVPISIADSHNNILVGSKVNNSLNMVNQSFVISENEDDFPLNVNLQTFPSNRNANSAFTYEQISRTIFVEENHVATILINTTANIDKNKYYDSYSLHTDTKVTALESRMYTSSNSIFSSEQLERIVSFVSSIAGIVSELLNTNYRLKNEIAINTESRKALEIANLKAAESDMLKNEFLRNISHEIRTPLNGIIGFSELLAMDRNNEKTEIYKNQIQASGYRLLEIIENIITFSQIQTGEVKISNSKTSIQSILDQVMMKFESKSEQRRNKLIQIKKSDNVDDIIITDSSKLSRMLELVMDNAIKFTFGGIIEFGGYITGNNKKRAILFISDNGIGIPGEEHLSVFEAFRQVETGLTRDYGGNGLGLSITKSFVDAMGGKVKLTSEPGKGTKIVISVPVL
jgi:signal transduction histidine kinase